MLFKVEMIVNIPESMDPDTRAEILATEKAVTVDGTETISVLVQKMKEASVAEADIATVINDAIDTVDGMAAKTMSFDVEFEATQTQPTSAS